MPVYLQKHNARNEGQYPETVMRLSWTGNASPVARRTVHELKWREG